jgi:hypothetical protein
MWRFTENSWNTMLIISVRYGRVEIEKSPAETGVSGKKE